MAERAIGISGLAARYAKALFELAKEKTEIDSTEEDLIALGAMLDGSSELNRLILSPVMSRVEQGAGLGGLTKNFIGLLARNRRLFVLRQIIQSFLDLCASDRENVMAEVISATPLNGSQVSAIANQLSRSVGKNAVVQSRVDEDLLGGLIVKMGSRMVDNSLRSKLERMKLVLKGIG